MRLAWSRASCWSECVFAAQVCGSGSRVLREEWEVSALLSAQRLGSVRGPYLFTCAQIETSVKDGSVREEAVLTLKVPGGEPGLLPFKLLVVQGDEKSAVGLGLDALLGVAVGKLVAEPPLPPQ